MANRHFAKIGDIWKHLPLAELLAIEKPTCYWESHAGSALYPMVRDAQREYGVLHFLQHGIDSASLADSQFLRLLQSREQDGRLIDYSGSPLIALSECGLECSFLFCDIDQSSLDNIKEAAAQLGITVDRIETVCADGTSTLVDRLSKLDQNSALDTFLHIDPYRPFATTAVGHNSVTLFRDAVLKNAKTMLWYGFDSPQSRELVLDEIRSSFADSSKVENVWCSDICVTAIDDPAFDYNPGALGCCIVCGNLSAASISSVDKSGAELESIYADTVLPTGHSGAIRYRSQFLSSGIP